MQARTQGHVSLCALVAAIAIGAIGCSPAPTLAELRQQAASAVVPLDGAVAQLEAGVVPGEGQSDAPEGPAWTGNVWWIGGDIRVEAWEPMYVGSRGVVLVASGDEASRWVVREDGLAEQQLPSRPAEDRLLRWYEGQLAGLDGATTVRAAESVSGRPCWLIEAASEPADLETSNDQAFTTLSSLWIDQETWQPLRAEGSGGGGCGPTALTFGEYEELPGGGLLPRRTELASEACAGVFTTLAPMSGGDPLDVDLVSIDATRAQLELSAQGQDRGKLDALAKHQSWDDPGSGPTRNAIFHPMSVLKALEVGEGDVVADIGAGEGYFAFRFAQAVGPTGTVWATEANPSLVAWLEGRLGDEKADPHRNVRVHLNEYHDLGLPEASLDLALVCDLTFPRFSHLSPSNRSMVRSIYKALRPRGRLAVIEKRSGRDVQALTPVTWAGVLPRGEAAPAEPDDSPSIAPGPFLAAGLIQTERFATLVEGHDFVVFEKPANAGPVESDPEDEYAPYGDPGDRSGNATGLSDADLAPLRDLGYDLDAVRGDEALLLRLANLTKYLGPARDAWQRPHDVIALFSIESGQVVADVGSASGYFAWHLSEAVGRGGQVHAVDVDATACDFMRRRLEHEPPPHANVRVVQSRTDDVSLEPESIDHALLVDAEFFVVHDDVTRACLASLMRAVRPGGRIVVVETVDKAERGEVTPEQIRAPFEEAGFTHAESHDLLRHASRNRPSGQHCMVFTRPL